jgi:hypothetical protein
MKTSRSSQLDVPASGQTDTRSDLGPGSTIDEMRKILNKTSDVINKTNDVGLSSMNLGARAIDRDKSVLLLLQNESVSAR